MNIYIYILDVCSYIYAHILHMLETLATFNALNNTLFRREASVLKDDPHRWHWSRKLGMPYYLLYFYLEATCEAEEEMSKKYPSLFVE